MCYRGYSMELYYYMLCAIGIRFAFPGLLVPLGCPWGLVLRFVLQACCKLKSLRPQCSDPEPESNFTIQKRTPLNPKPCHDFAGRFPELRERSFSCNPPGRAM